MVTSLLIAGCSTISSIRSAQASASRTAAVAANIPVCEVTTAGAADGKLGEGGGVATRGDGVTDLGVGVWGDVAEDRLIGIRARGSCEGATDLLPEEGTCQANLRVEDGDDERAAVGDRHPGAAAPARLSPARPISRPSAVM